MRLNKFINEYVKVLYVAFIVLVCMASMFLGILVLVIPAAIVHELSGNMVAAKITGVVTALLVMIGVIAYVKLKSDGE